MQIHELTQGSNAWHAYRAQHFNASDAPAMLGCSPYKKRTELLHERHVGIAKEVDGATQVLFDNGHRFEALARVPAEEIVGEDLYPVTGSSGKYSASFDGLTMAGNIAWEHKTLNDEIRAADDVADLGKHLRVQMEQQLLVSEADKCLFLATLWDNEGNLIEKKHFWYLPDADLRAEIIAGWDQFEIDLAAYQPKELAEKPLAAVIMQLPALSVQIRGEVVASNLPAFKTAAIAYIAGIKTDLETDDDFANAEATVKFCKEAEDNLDLTKAAAIGQTASIDDLMKTIDFISAELRNKRLSLEKLVTKKKSDIKEKIQSDVRKLYQDHIANLEAEIKPLRLTALPAPDFVGAAKSKRTLASLHDAVNTELARAKMAADAVALDYRNKLAWCKANAEGFGFLFSDLAQLISKPTEDFQLVVNTRIADHRRAEEVKAEEQREAIRKEEETKALAKFNAEQAAANPVSVSAQPAATPEPAAAPRFTSRRPAIPATEARPSDDQIIEALALQFRVHESKVIQWLLAMDLSAASERMAALL